MSQVLEADSPQAGTVIPATKLQAPPARDGLIARESLVTRLVEASGRLVLLDAPAGFGKTTLCAEWSASPREERPFAWLSLDDGDNDPVRFWGCVIGALRTVEPKLGESARRSLSASKVSLLELAVPQLVNELASVSSSLVLVLDDYHLIRDRQVHDSVGFLVDHLPDTIQLVISTRSDPPLPIVRLRARGQLSEVRAADLRFSDREATDFLNAALGLELELADVARLQGRTEGWPAGLYLAALSLRGQEDVQAFIASFAGDDRQIVDYLSAEALAGQPDNVREFLLRTSILERLCGGLCDAVAETSGSHETLDEVERSNLFLVPLDTTREWYRYHHLFRDLLRHELQRTKPGSLPALHERAHRWHAEHGMVSEAIEHAIAASDIDAARSLIASSWNEFFNQGRLQTVSSWLEAMPSAVVRDDPRLCAAGAWLALDRGRLAGAAEWIASAERAYGPGVEDPEIDFDESEVAVLRAVHSFKVADLATAEASALRALDLEPGPFPGFVAHCILGVTLYWRGERADEAISTLEHAARMARETSNDLGHGYALGYLALVSAERGELDQAERLAGSALGLSDDPGFVEHFVTTVAHLARGLVAMRRGRVEGARASIARALELARRGAGALELAASLNRLAEVRQLQGARDNAEQLVREARLTLDGATDVGLLGQALNATERSLRVAERQTARKAPLPEPLTDRESAVLRLLDSDLSRREIGEALYVSVDTVKTHVRGIYRKLGVSTRQEAVERAHDVGVL